MTPVPMMNNFGGPGPQGPPIPMEEPVEKKRKTTVNNLLYWFQMFVVIFLKFKFNSFIYG